MVAKTLHQLCHDTLFSEPDQSVYAVLDGASFGGTLARSLQRHQAESVCLYRGELAADIAAVAPYLVSLPAEGRITSWVLKHVGHNYPGIFALSQASLETLRKHFRTFLMIHDVNDQPVYFRYYDPRVLRSYVPTCNAAEKQTLFGPVNHYFAENRQGDQLHRFSLND